MKEIWKDINGYESKYKISNLGRVKSVERQVYTKDGRLWRVHKERILKPCDYSGRSYPIVALCSGNRVYRSHRIHRLLADHFLSAKKEDQVDHIDGDRTNNSLSNLRLCTPSQNAANRTRLPPKKHGKFRGTTFVDRVWMAQIQVRNKHYNLGRFKTEEEAAAAYNEAARKHFGDFACLNKI